MRNYDDNDGEKYHESHLRAFGGQIRRNGGRGGGAILAMLGFWEHLVSQPLPNVKIFR